MTVTGKRLLEHDQNASDDDESDVDDTDIIRETLNSKDEQLSKSDGNTVVSETEESD